MKKQIMLSVLVLVSIGLFFGCATNPWKGVVYRGEQDQMISGSRWECLITYANGSVYIEYVELISGGQAIWSTQTVAVTSSSQNSTWERNGSLLRVVAYDGFLLYEGNITENSGVMKVLGTLKDGNGNNINFVMTKQ